MKLYKTQVKKKKKKLASDYFDNYEYDIATNFSDYEKQ